MNIINRGIVRSMASAIVKLEQKDSCSYKSDSVVDIWNDKYGLVDAAELPKLQKQVALEVVAERNAINTSISISKVGFAELKLDDATGNLTVAPDLDLPDTDFA